jgi:hypothetical protein
MASVIPPPRAAPFTAQPDIEALQEAAHLQAALPHKDVEAEPGGAVARQGAAQDHRAERVVGRGTAEVAQDGFQEVHAQCLDRTASERGFGDTIGCCLGNFIGHPGISSGTHSALDRRVA